MTYVPNTPEEQQSMLEHLGLSSMEDLLRVVPQEVRLHRPLNLPVALPDPDLKRLLSGMAAQNKPLDTTISFLGAGTYHRMLPSVVPHLPYPSKFTTAYSTYQAEVSQ